MKRETPGFYPIQTTTNVLRSSIDSKHCAKMIEWSEQHRAQGIEDNLISESRTPWNINTLPGFEEAYLPMLEKINVMLESYVNTEAIYGHSCDSYGVPNGTMMSIHSIDAWTAWFDDGGATLPHTHASLLNHFSTVLYLRLPKGKTSLEFFSHPSTKTVIRDLKEGDLLLFPSNVSHYTFDVERGRIVTSANWAFNVDYSWLKK